MNKVYRTIETRIIGVDGKEQKAQMAVAIPTEIELRGKTYRLQNSGEIIYSEVKE